MALMNRNSSVTRPGIGSLSRQNSGIRGVNSPTISTKQMPPKEEGRIDAGGKNPPNYKLETVQACQLITYIYESKLKAALEDHSEINFYECEPLLEFTKEVETRLCNLTFAFSFALSQICTLSLLLNRGC